MTTLCGRRSQRYDKEPQRAPATCSDCDVFVSVDRFQVWEYRRQVHAVMERIIRQTQWRFPIQWDDLQQWVIFMGMEHERIHLETSSVLIRENQLSHTKKPAGWRYGPSLGMPPPNEMVKFASGGVTRVGKPRSFPTYGWDCEYGEQTVCAASTSRASLACHRSSNVPLWLEPRCAVRGVAIQGHQR